jgi:hypothetical protein
VELAATPTGVALLASLEPRVLLQFPRLSQLDQAGEGQLFTLEADAVALLLAGSCRRRNGEDLRAAQSAAAPITFIGLVDYLLGLGTSPGIDRTELSAATGGCRWLTFQRRHFRELLDIAPVLETLIIRQLALANRRPDPATQI